MDKGPSLSNFLFLLCVLELCGYAIFMTLNVIALSFAWKWLHSYQKPSRYDWKLQQGVSIIKPLIGFDKNMKENIESFFHLDYPNFELLFCIAEKRNKYVQEFLEELMTEYPSVQAVVYHGGEKVGVNPKINNMLPGYRNAKHDLIWISDHNIKTSEESLKEMVSHMDDPQVGLVHQLPYVDKVDSFTGYLEKVYFGTQHARVYLLAAWAGENCANGMSWLVRKKALEQEGGLLAFKEYLAEDYFMSKAIWIRGWKFALSTIPSRQNPETRSLSIYQARMVRWGRLRTSMMPWPGLLEPVTESLCLGVLSGFCFYIIFDVHPLLFFLPHLATWLCLDFLLLNTVEHHEVLSSAYWLLLAWILREVWTLPMFLMGVWSREVVWKGQKYQLQMGGKATKLS